MNTDTMELNLNEMEMINGGLDQEKVLDKGFKGSTAGLAIGAAAGSFFPIVGSFAGALIGSAVGFTVGSTMGIIDDLRGIR